MKYFLVVVMMIVAMSCRAPVESLYSDEDSYNSIPVAPTTYQEARSLVQDNITYLYDAEDDWQSPQKTWATKTGDCEDFALLLAYFLKNMGYSPEILMVELGTLDWHVIVRVDGKYIEPQVSYWDYDDFDTSTIVHVYSYEEALKLCDIR